MKERLKVLKTIHIALCLGIALPYFLIGNIASLDFLKIPEIDSSKMIFFAVPIAAIIFGHLLFKQQLKLVDKNLTLEEKIGSYQTASLIRWAMLEGAAFFILFVEEELILIGVMLILYMVYLRPSEERMKRDLEMAQM